MNSTPILRSFAILFLVCELLVSCSNDNSKNAPVQQTADAPPVVPETAAPMPVSFGKMKVATFEVKDSTSGKPLGWGYDILFEGGGKVHQPTIPAIQGIQYFSTEEKAKKTADFAVSKIQRSGGLTGITLEELDSLGVTK